MKGHKYNFGKYPILSNDEFSEKYMGKSNENPEGYYVYIRKIDYKSDGDNYLIRIIGNYAAPGKNKLSVVKIENNKVFWKDNVATLDQDIEDIDWDSVNYQVEGIRINSDGKREIVTGPLPEYIE